MKNTLEQFSTQIEQAKKTVVVGGLYAHYRDFQSCYKVIDIAVIEATQELAVIYQSVGSPIWIRPISSWLEKIEVNGIQVPRFQIR